MQRFWRPFILDGEIIRPDYTKSRVTMPLTMGVLELFRLLNLAMLAVVAIAIWNRSVILDLISSWFKS